MAISSRSTSIDRGRFTDRAEALGLVDRVGGRGVACFDADGDGDLDVFIANNCGTGVATPLPRGPIVGGAARATYSGLKPRA